MADDVNEENLDHESTPAWLAMAMDVYKVLWVFNSSVNFYLYRLKISITKGTYRFCCKPNQTEGQHERIQLQLTMSTKTSKFYSRCSSKNLLKT